MGGVEKAGYKNPIDFLTVYQQDRYHSCGPASIRMMLSCYGINFQEREIAKARVTIEGFDWEAVLDFLHILTGFTVSLYAYGEYEDVLAQFKKYHAPILICWNPTQKEWEDHFSVIKDIAKECVVIADPDGGVIRTLQKEEFIDCWYGAGIVRPYLMIHPKSK